MAQPLLCGGFFGSRNSPNVSFFVSGGGATPARGALPFMDVYHRFMEGGRPRVGWLNGFFIHHIHRGMIPITTRWGEKSFPVVLGALVSFSPSHTRPVNRKERHPFAVVGGG